MEIKVILSIIIPVFNAESYIKQCLDSICLQNHFDKTEIICVNDGSTDNSYQILAEYQNKFSNVVVINKENGGASSARNVGLSQAKGEYVWFVDADDYVFNGALNLCEILKDESVDLITFSWDKGKELKENLKKDFVILDKELKINHCSWGNILKTEIIKKYNLQFNQNLKYGEDILFWYTALQYVNTVLKIDKCIYFYRETPNSIIRSKKSKEEVTRRINDELTLLNALKEIRNKGGIEQAKLSQYEQMIYFCSQRIMAECLPYSTYTYKQSKKIIKDNQLIFPFKFRVGALKDLKGKPFNQKIKKIYSVYFPKLHFKTHYKKESKK